MKRIYKRSDRITVQIDDITVKLSPLTFDQKNEIQQAMVEGSAKKDLAQLSKGISLAMKYSLRGLEGVESADGTPYKLAYDEAGNLTDECIDDLYNLEQKDRLILVCSKLAQSIPGEFCGADGKPLEGVSIVGTSSSEGSKVPNV